MVLWGSPSSLCQISWPYWVMALDGSKAGARAARPRERSSSARTGRALGVLTSRGGLSSPLMARRDRPEATARRLWISWRVAFDASRRSGNAAADVPRVALLLYRISTSRTWRHSFRRWCRSGAGAVVDHALSWWRHPEGPARSAGPCGFAIRRRIPSPSSRTRSRTRYRGVRCSPYRSVHRSGGSPTTVVTTPSWLTFRRP